MRRIEAKRRGRDLSERERVFFDNIALVGVVMGRLPEGVYGIVCAEEEDIFAEGLKGLWKAAGSYRGDKAAISTYGISMIRWEILKYLERRCYIGGIKIRRELFWAKFRVTTISLDGISGSGGSVEREVDSVVSRSSLWDEVEGEMWVEWVLSLLPPRRREIMRCLYVEGMTKAEVARRVGLSKPSVRRNEVAALKFLSRVEDIRAEAEGYWDIG